MDSPTPNPTVVFAHILTSCESGTLQLPEDHDAMPYAENMRDSGILVELKPGSFTLSPRGMTLLMLLEKLRDFALATE